MRKPIVHGTTSGYGYHKCRCGECKEANNTRARRWRENNPEKFAESLRRYKEANTEKVADCQRRWREANPKRLAENRRRYREDNPEKKLEWDRRWREANREKALESGRRWREANPGRAAEHLKSWQETNPERNREINRLKEHRYRARKREAFIEDVPPLEIFTRDGWQCMIPGCLYPGVLASRDVAYTNPLYASVDHVIPLAQGGQHERSNLACSHLRCNLAKGHRAGILLKNGSQL